MEDSQREAMYNGWARGKKWIKVTVEKKPLDNKFEIIWKACAEHTFNCIERPTKILAIQKMQGMLAERGYEISNMTELMGIEERVKAHEDSIDALQARKTPEGVKLAAKNIIDGTKEKHTFLEWLKKIEFDTRCRKIIEAWIASERDTPKVDYVDPLTYAEECALRKEQDEKNGWYEHKNDVPQHKLKDPSMEDRIAAYIKMHSEEYPSRRLRRVLNDLDYNK